MPGKRARGDYMALIKCPDCGREVSTTAGKCPQCGAKIKKPKKPFSKLAALFLLLFVGFFIYMSMQADRRKADDKAAADSKEAALTPEQRGQEKADTAKRDSQLQLGAQGALTLKHAAKDPEAFELRKAVVKIDGATCYSYRAKNSFGAVMPGEAVLSKTGHIYIKEQDESGFARVWNKECAVAGGDDVAETIKRLGILDE